MSEITKNQIKWIHVLKSKLKMTDINYRAALDAQFGVESCKELTFQQADAFITRMEGWYVGGDIKKANELRIIGNSADYPSASLEQIKLIWRLWNQVTRQKSDAEIKTGLRNFCKTITGVSDTRFLIKEDASKLINALKNMRSAKMKAIAGGGK